MTDFGGGIPGQVVGELTSIPKQAVKDTAKAFGDIAVGTAEKIVATSSGQPSPPQADRPLVEADNQIQTDPQAILSQQREAARRRRLAEVRAELEEHFQKKKQEERQEEQIEEQKEMEKVQMKKSKDKQREQEVLGRLSRQYGGTGEVGKGGN